GGVQGVPMASGPEYEEDGVHRLAVGDPGVVAAQRVGRPGRQEGFDPLPQGVGDAPLIVTNTSGGGPQGGRDLGHGQISWCKLKYQEILRNLPTGIRSK